jgi:MSHA biogenesis protein MshL
MMTRMMRMMFTTGLGLLVTMALLAGPQGQRDAAAIQIDARPVGAGGQGLPQPQSPQAPAIQLDQINPNITDRVYGSLDFSVPTSLKQILSVLAQDAGLNLSMPDELSKQVTLSVKDVTLEQALNIILGEQGLQYRIEGKVLRVFKPVMVDAMLDFVYITNKRSRTTSLSASATAGFSGGGVGGLSGGGGGVSGGSSTSISGSESTDLLAKVEAMIKAYATTGGGAILQFNPQLGQFHVRDYPENIAAMKNFLDQTAAAAKMQVYIEANLVEVELNKDSQSGVNWSAVLGNTFSFSSSFATASNFQASISFKGFSALISALTTYGDVNVLSNPSVSTLNGQPAVVKIGTQDVFFITQVTSDPRTGQIIQTAETPATINEGVVLDVTPNIDKDGTMFMSIHPTITERTATATSAQGNTVPIMAVRETDTTLRVRDGETIVIAGLIQDKVLRNTMRTPFSKIPFIGGIFGKKSTESTKTDTVIMLTPHIFNLNQVEELTRARQERLEALRQEIEKEVDPKKDSRKR